MVTTEVLKSVPLFTTLPDSQLAALAACVTLRKYPRGRFILHAGQGTDGLYIMLSGRAKIVISDDEGHTVILAFIGARDFFGEMALIDDQPRSASVEAVQACTLMHISRTQFNRCLLDSFELAMRIVRALVQRLRHADRQIESLALMDVYGRVARLLLDLAESSDGKRTIQNAPSKQEIAQMIGASREMVSRVLRNLQLSGHIRIDKRCIVLLDRLGTRKRSK